MKLLKVTANYIYFSTCIQCKHRLVVVGASGDMFICRHMCESVSLSHLADAIYRAWGHWQVSNRSSLRAATLQIRGVKVLCTVLYWPLILLMIILKSLFINSWMYFITL